MSASNPKKNSFFGGAAILTAGIIIVKLIGALYKIPLGNILSDRGFADFNTAYDIYSLLIIISTGGLPVALSKMVSEANAQGRVNQVNRVFRLAAVAFCVLGTLSFIIMAVFPKQLAGLMNNSRSYWSILALSPAVFFICPMSALRGYFQGHSLMTPTAISQILEAMCKLVIGLVLASLIMRAGQDESLAAAGAILGVSVGVLLAMLYMYWCYRGHQAHQRKSKDTPDGSREILSTLAKLAIPITIGSSIIAATNILDSAILMDRLQEALGMTEDAARTLKGVYNKTMTLYNLPSSFMVPLTSSVIPAVSAARTVRNYKQGALVMIFHFRIDCSQSFFIRFLVLCQILFFRSFSAVYSFFPHKSPAVCHRIYCFLFMYHAVKIIFPLLTIRRQKLFPLLHNHYLILPIF